MEKIIVKNTCIIVNDYSFGDCPKLERFFAIYEPVTHSYRYTGIYYDMSNKRLYLPRGIDIWYLENLLDAKAVVEVNKYNEYDTYRDIKINTLPRDDDQVEALKFATGKGVYGETIRKSQLSINLNTGKGKTYVAIGTISVFGIKTIIINKSTEILNQWKRSILKFTNITEKEIYSIDGSGSIYRLKTKSEQEIKSIKIFLVTHATIASYCNTNGWESLNDLFKYLRIGIKIYDEAHLNFDNMCMIDFFTNVYKTYYLTATPARSNTDENKIYQTSFKNVLAIDLFHQDTDPHTHYIAMRYYSRPEPQIVSMCRNKYGLDRNKYMNYIVTNDRFKIMSTVVLDFIFRNIMKNVEDKLLIYIGTNSSIMVTYYWLKYYYPTVSIGLFSSLVPKDKKRDELNNKIILTTIHSAGAALDIKGLEITILLNEPFKSQVYARQTLGRTRARDTKYIEIVDTGFEAIRYYYNYKKKIFRKYAKSMSEIQLSDFELNNKISEVNKERRLALDQISNNPNIQKEEIQVVEVKK